MISVTQGWSSENRVYRMVVLLSSFDSSETTTGGSSLNGRLSLCQFDIFWPSVHVALSQNGGRLVVGGRSYRRGRGHVLCQGEKTLVKNVNCQDDFL